MFDHHNELPPETVLAIYAVYRGITGHPPPQAERLQALGTFVIVFEREGVDLDNPSDLDGLKAEFAREFGLSGEVIDFTRRVHRGWVHQVALVRGISTYDRLCEELPQRDGYTLVFSHRHTASDNGRLPEFHQYVADGEAQPAPSWDEQVEAAKAIHAWSRTDAYVPPDYEGFFPDDPEGGQQLDKLIAAGDNAVASDREMLEIARRGWRRS